MLRKAIITVAVLLLVCICPAQAQQRRSSPPPRADSVISLLNAEWAKLQKIGFHDYRLIKGPAAFFHNGAYLFCDSAAWDIDRDIIKAYGKVRIVQDKTILRSDSLTYLIDDNLAQFRGPLVDVFDNEGDTLRTNNLDYNTKDSLAIFRNGGSMKDKDGNVIEGKTGIYASRQKVFTFQENVQMFTDSIFLMTEKLDYISNERKAYFRDKTYVWRENGFVKALAGWYDTENEIVQFNDDVYIKDPDYELWADEVYYYRKEPRYEAYHNVQVLDTLHESAFVAHKAVIVTDSLNNHHMEFTESPAVFYFGENEDHVKDSLFFASDSIRVYTVRRCDIPQADVDARLKDRKDILFDAIAEAETKAAEDRAKALAEAEAKRPENIARQRREKLAAKNTVDSLAALGIPATDSLYNAAGLDPSEEKQKIIEKFGSLPEPEVEETPQEEAPQDTVVATPRGIRAGAAQADGAEFAVVSDAVVAADSTVSAAADSTVSATADSTAAAAAFASQLDTTRIKYIQGWPDVRIYRSDMQLRCDSLAYSDIDSLARMFGNPVMWYKTRNQLTADLMILLMQDESLRRGSMQQNAMLVMQEDSVHFDQIKSTEMLGHFSDDDLYRYDALGGVNAMFYLKEKEEITTINIKESRFMTMALKDGTAQRIKYYEQTQSDAYPIYNLELDKQRIKGFQWRGEERPLSRYEITRRSLKPSERDAYDDVQMPAFRISDRYFNKYMSNVYKQILAREEARAQAKARRDSIAAAAQDSALLIPQDSLLVLPDSLSVIPEDVIAATADSLQTVPPADEIDEEERTAAERRNRPVRRQQADEETIEEAAVEEKPAAVPVTVPEQAPESVSEALQPALPEMSPREQRVLRKADRMIQRNDKRFFRRLYREIKKSRVLAGGQ
jgi:lipopolysaccharide export system protein LptA